MQMPRRVIRPCLIILIYFFVELLLHHICHLRLSYGLKLMESIP